MENSRFNAVYELYADMVYRICFVMLRGRSHDAEDAAQAVFLKYLETPAPPEGEHLKAWLIVVAQNTCRSKLRKMSRFVGLDAVPEQGQEHPYGEVMSAIMELPEKEKMAVLLCLYEGYTAAEAAKLMQCRENTVYSYIHRAKKRLRKALGDEGE